MQWKHAKGFLNPAKCSNVFIAAFTTSYARLELYSVMDNSWRILSPQPDSFEKIESGLQQKGLAP